MGSACGAVGGVQVEHRSCYYLPDNRRSASLVLSARILILFQLSFVLSLFTRRSRETFLSMWPRYFSPRPWLVSEIKSQRYDNLILPVFSVFSFFSSQVQGSVCPRGPAPRSDRGRTAHLTALSQAHNKQDQKGIF